MNKTPIIYRVLSGTASEPEKKELDEWLALSEGNRLEFDDIKLLWENSSPQDQSIPKSQFYDGLIKIKALMQHKLKKRERNKRTVALIILIVLILTLLLFFLFRKNTETNEYIKYDKVSLSFVLQALEKKYDVSIELEKRDIANCKFTGAFYMANNVNSILQALDEALSLKHESVGPRKYRLTGTGCPQSLLP